VHGGGTANPHFTDVAARHLVAVGVDDLDLDRDNGPSDGTDLLRAT